jgi:hypothetical protein
MILRRTTTLRNGGSFAILEHDKLVTTASRQTVLWSTIFSRGRKA